jgi:protein farnesyltransferase subunit beta
MPILIKRDRHHRQVVFSRNPATFASDPSSRQPQQDPRAKATSGSSRKARSRGPNKNMSRQGPGSSLDPDSVYEDADEEVIPESEGTEPTIVPGLYTTLPPIRDLLQTETSIVQDKTIQEVLPHISGQAILEKSPFDLNSHGVPGLKRDKHAWFLRQALGNLPAGFVAADASRPWMIYWALMGLSVIGENVSYFRDR